MTTERIAQWESVEIAQIREQQAKDITAVKGTLPSTSKTKNVITETEIVIPNSVDTPENVKEQALKTETTEQVHVSPYDFGPYPKIPDGLPQSFFYREMSRETELLGRVRIKKYNQDIPVQGIGFEKHTGKVYPFDKDQFYMNSRKRTYHRTEP